jgi:hypothetical protein
VFELVYTVLDYYDGPRSGIADNQGKPHLFQSEWRDIHTGPDGEVLDDDIFLLMPVEPSIFELSLESWAIWRRYETALHLGIAPPGCHPSLPEEKLRHQEIQRLLEGRLAVDPAKSIRKRAELRMRNDPDWSGQGFPSLEVHWTDID